MTHQPIKARQVAAVQASERDLLASGNSVTATLETMPLEILNRIFTFAASEEVDLGLALSSRSLAHRLLYHPIIRTIQALTTETQQTDVFRSLSGSGGADQDLYCLEILSTDGAEKARIREQIGTCSWCTKEFVGQLQVALIKRTLREHWDPLLLRDGHSSWVSSNPRVWTAIDQLGSDHMALMEDCKLVSPVETGLGCYSWVRVCIWPRQARIVIRDQLYNQSQEFAIPLLDSFLAMKPPHLELLSRDCTAAMIET